MLGSPEFVGPGQVAAQRVEPRERRSCRRGGWPAWTARRSTARTLSHYGRSADALTRRGGAGPMPRSGGLSGPTHHRRDLAGGGDGSGVIAGRQRAESHAENREVPRDLVRPSRRPASHRGGPSRSPRNKKQRLTPTGPFDPDRPRLTPTGPTTFDPDRPQETKNNV